MLQQNCVTTSIFELYVLCVCVYLTMRKRYVNIYGDINIPVKQPKIYTAHIFTEINQPYTFSEGITFYFRIIFYFIPILFLFFERLRNNNAQVLADWLHCLLTINNQLRCNWRKFLDRRYDGTFLLAAIMQINMRGLLATLFLLSILFSLIFPND